jgi:glycine cleavage system aminomethyltransferase T
MRDRVGLVDLAAFSIFRVTGPGALDALQRLAVAQMDVPIGRIVYTPFLNEAGGIKADLTIARDDANAFTVVTGGASGRVDRKWIEDHLPADGATRLIDETFAWCTIGLWGPRARDVLASVTDGDVSNAAFPFSTMQNLAIGSVPAIASRISYIGELGWEIYTTMDLGRSLWDTLWEAGQPHHIVPVGIGVYATTARLEKGYRAHGNELELEYDLAEAGMARPTVKPQDFIGKEATPSTGVKRYMLGKEPILMPDRSPIVDAKGRRSYATSAGSGPSVGKHLIMAYLPPEQAVAGTKLLVEYFGEQYPVTVAVVGSTPLFDPENSRVRA